MANKTYLTTTLPYVNADPHIGFALELVQADIIARYRTLLGDEVLLNTGTDEHGLKIHRKALEEGKDPQAYVDEYAAKFRELLPALGIKEEKNLKVSFVRTTDPHHIKAAQEFWRRCAAAGDIYKKEYKVKYCVGCEMEKTDSELVDGKCPIHSNLELEIIEEENYFFKFSKYQQSLLELYAKPDFVLPPSRLNEIRSFVERGLQDFSISRLVSKMPWGILVPNDPAHVMYVWFDALVNYVSVLGWPSSAEATEGKPGAFCDWWPAVQFAGKDNLRPQSAMWQAMLLSAGLPSSKQIIIHGFIQSNGQKMSKSLGNVINPLDLVEEYKSVTDFSADVLRYFLARHVSTFEDGDVTLERFKEAYNAGLANGLGNLVSRVMKMASTHLDKPVELTKETIPDPHVAMHLDAFEIGRAIDSIWERIGHDDALIAIEKPFSGIKSDDSSVRDEALLIIKKLVRELNAIATDLEPFLPATSAAIKQLVIENKMPEKPLFLRK